MPASTCHPLPTLACRDRARFVRAPETTSALPAGQVPVRHKSRRPSDTELWRDMPSNHRQSIDLHTEKESVPRDGTSRRHVWSRCL